MGFEWIGLLLSVLWFSALIVQWAGVLAMNRGRPKCWWAMLAGVALTTSAHLFGLLVYWAPNFFGIKSILGSTESPGPTLMRWLAVIGSLGTVIFFLGFMLHALSRRAELARLEELETLTAAMAEELRVLREGRA